MDHAAWEKAKAGPTLTQYTCTDCALVVDNQTKSLTPKMKELMQLEPDQMAFQWKANQQGVVSYQQHGDDHRSMGTNSM